MDKPETGTPRSRPRPVPGPAQLTRGMRRLLLVATILVVLAGVALFVFSERTEDWFAWTVTPPLTAAFLGAAYWASAVVEWTSSRASAWADARVAVPSVFVFTTLTLGVTLIHLDRFHLGADLAIVTRAITWAWIAVYVVVPVLMVVLWVAQRRVPGGDPPRRYPLPGLLRLAVALSAVLLLVAGGWLLLAPQDAADWWPWELTPLTGRAIGAWLVGLGVSAAQTVLEADARRARPVAAGAIALAVLVSVALARYGADVAWGTLPAAVLVAALAAWAVMGAAIIAVERRGPRVPT